MGLSWFLYYFETLARGILKNSQLHLYSHLYRLYAVLKLLTKITLKRKLNKNNVYSEINVSKYSGE